MGKTYSDPQITATALLLVDIFLDTKPLKLRELLPKVGIAPDISFKPEVMIPLRSVIELYEHLSRELKNDAVGVIVGSMAPIGAPGVFDYTALSAPTLEVALNNWVRFHSMISDGFSLKYKIDGDNCVLEWEFNEFLGQNTQFMGLAEAFIASRLRYILGNDTVAITGKFQHSKPNQLQVYENLIGTELHFDQPSYQLLFPKSFLPCKPPCSEPNLYTIIEQAALNEIKNIELKSDELFSITQEIGNAIKAGKVSINIVANEIGMSPRSLQRILEMSGTTFSQLTDDIPKSMAQRYLLETEIPLNEIAFLLGYSEPSVFSRAGKIWFGVSPKEYRKKKEADG